MPDFMLAKEYTKDMKSPKNDPQCLPPLNWLVSEKYDGYRSRYMYNDKIFISRQEKLFNAPNWFKSAMPDCNLDGELWIDRHKFQEMGVVRKKIPIPEEWVSVKYIVYDLPDLQLPFHERLKHLKKIIQENISRWDSMKQSLGMPYQNLKCPLILAKQIKIKSHDHLEDIYQKIIQNNGEGIMLKCPNSSYENKRSNYMLKYKPSFDEEAIIVDYKLGKGKYSGLLGGFICKPLINMNTYHLIDKHEHHEFTISGMDDNVRHDYGLTHPIGTFISFEHSGKTTSGKPRFARYIRKRNDIHIKEDIQNKSLDKRNLVIHILKIISDSEKIKGDHYKSRSYLKSISSLNTIKDDSDLTEQNIKQLDGIGNSIYDKINVILKTGTCPQYDSIQSLNDPRHTFLKIHGVGPQAATKLIKSGFTSIQDLRNCKDTSNHLTNAQQIGLTYYEDILEPIPHHEIQKHEQLLQKILQKIDPQSHLTIAGSYRRQKDFSGDIDVLIKSNQKDTFKKFIVLLKELDYLQDHLAIGIKKYNGICKLGKRGINRRIDIMNTLPHEYPFAILYFTGSDEFNKLFRQRCLDKGFTINEYNLKKNDTKEIIQHVFNSEKDIFDFLNIQYVDPTQRF